MLVLIVMATVIAVGLVAIALGGPRVPEVVVWNDAAERRMLHDGRIDTGWW